jgi:L-2-hydroxyglutarate oxidase
MTTAVDVAIVGGGIVGLATAHRLLATRPGLSVVVVERADDVGTQQSSRNSGVLHAGLYYPPGSAKARWCRDGKARLEAFCAEHDVPVRRVGKVVVALTREEVPRLAALAERARTNGVEIHERGPDGIRDHEPHVDALAGLWTPETAVTDFHAVCRTLAGLVRAAGGEVRTSTEVTGLSPAAGGGARLRTVGVGGAGAGEVQELRARTVVVCAGVAADRLARAAGVRPRDRIVPFRGSWLEVVPEHADLVRGNVYPVPVPGLPFLGVHLTRRIDGRLWLGPNAVLALAATGARPWSVAPRHLAATLAYPGLWRLARRNLGVAAGEVWRDLVPAATVAEARRAVPALRRADVRRGPFGVRAQLLGRDGTLVDDFRIVRVGSLVLVRNAPSPAATASLAIGDELTRRALDVLDG